MGSTGLSPALCHSGGPEGPARKGSITIMGLMKKIFGDYSSRELKSIYPIVDKIESMADEYKAMSDEALRAKTTEFKERLQNGETLDDIQIGRAHV